MKVPHCLALLCESQLLSAQWSPSCTGLSINDVTLQGGGSKKCMGDKCDGGGGGL